MYSNPVGIQMFSLSPVPHITNFTRKNMSAFTLRKWSPSFLLIWVELSPLTNNKYQFLNGLLRKWFETRVQLGQAGLRLLKRKNWTYCHCEKVILKGSKLVMNEFHYFWSKEDENKFLNIIILNAKQHLQKVMILKINQYSYKLLISRLLNLTWKWSLNLGDLKAMYFKRVEHWQSLNIKIQFCEMIFLLL